MGTRTIRSLLLLATVFSLLAPARALAHEGEEGLPARLLIEQAIALLRSQPEQTAPIQDKINDALEAQDAEGVDLALVEHADEAFGAGQLHEAQDLLELSIGAAPHTVVSSPNPEPGVPAPSPEPGMEPSPVLHEEALEGGDQEVRGGPALLGLAAALALVGLIVVKRAR